MENGRYEADPLRWIVNLEPFGRWELDSVSLLGPATIGQRNKLFLYFLQRVGVSLRYGRLFGSVTGFAFHGRPGELKRSWLSFVRIGGEGMEAMTLGSEIERPASGQLNQSLGGENVFCPGGTG